MFNVSKSAPAWPPNKLLAWVPLTLPGALHVKLWVQHTFIPCNFCYEMYTMAPPE